MSIAVNNKKIILGFLLIVFLLLLLPGNANAAAWYDSSWQYRKTLTIQGSQVSGTVTNFPVLHSVTDGDLTKAQLSGNDFLVTSSDGVTKLNHEIEFFNNATGELVLWVNVPSLSNPTNEVLYLYYGKALSLDQQNVSGTWNANYKFVQHLDETAGNAIDSTIESNDLIPQNGPNQNATGKIDGADSFNGTTQYLNNSSPAGLPSGGSARTLEAWINPTNVDPGGTILAYGPAVASGQQHFMLQINKAGANTYLITDDLNVANNIPISGAEIPSASTTSHIAFTLDNFNNWNYYLNGVFVKSGTFPVAINTAAPARLRVGTRTDFTFNHWPGMIDEVRINDSVLSADWITTEYNNESTPSTFIVSGLETTLSVMAPPTGFNSSLIIIIGSLAMFSGLAALKYSYSNMPARS